MTSHATLPALGPNPSTTEIDSVVHGLIDRHFAGDMDEETTRREIAGVIYVSGIHTDVAARRTDLSQQARRDLADGLLRIVTDRMINGDFFSLQTGRTTSACGWARQVARSAVQSEMRNARRAATRNGAPCDPYGPLFSSATSWSLVDRDTHAAHVDGTVGDLVEEFTTRAKGMRETDRALASAETLCVGLGVQPALRPESMADRDHCLVALQDDPMLAHRSLRAFRALVCGDDADGVGDIDDRLLALWDDQSEDSLEELLSRSPNVTHLIALAAVSPLPRPPKKVIAKVRTLACALPGQRDPRWRELASVLVDAYVASEYEPFSQYATMSADAKQATIVGHRIDRSRLEDLLARAVRHPGAPMGDHPRRVLATLAEIRDEVLAEEQAARAA